MDSFLKTCLGRNGLHKPVVAGLDVRQGVLKPVYECVWCGRSIPADRVVEGSRTVGS